jgi:hypothetical protein
MAEETNAANTVGDGSVQVINPVVLALQNENAALKAQLDLSITRADLMYQPYIDPPQSKEVLYAQACSGDTVTVKSFKPQWLDHWKKNGAKYDFKANSVMNDFGKFAFKPVICAGSGPSLKVNAYNLKIRDGIGLVACLHSLGFLEDLGCPADYYLTLDSQDITIGEMSQGGTKDEQYYWDLTKDRTLVACAVANPKLIEKWQGKILWYNTIVPDMEYQAEVDKTGFNLYFNLGGNALGACYYFARAILGACPIALVGADFCFSNKRKFHAWNSPYDQQFAGLEMANDVFGNRVYTWRSYFNFAKWFEFISLGGGGDNPHLFYNCTEGGILGAYPGGNVKSIIQMPLNAFIHSFNQHKMMKGLYESGSKTLLF